MGENGRYLPERKKSAESFSGILVPKSGMILKISFTKRGIEKIFSKILLSELCLRKCQKIGRQLQFSEGQNLSGTHPILTEK